MRQSLFTTHSGPPGSASARNMHVKLLPRRDGFLPPFWGLHNLGRRNYPAATVIFLVLGQVLAPFHPL
jgi:hypothetical protein